MSHTDVDSDGTSPSVTGATFCIVPCCQLRPQLNFLAMNYLYVPRTMLTVSKKL